MRWRREGREREREIHFASLSSFLLTQLLFSLLNILTEWKVSSSLPVATPDDFTTPNSSPHLSLSLKKMFTYFAGATSLMYSSHPSR